MSERSTSELRPDPDGFEGLEPKTIFITLNKAEFLDPVSSRELTTVAVYELRTRKEMFYLTTHSTHFIYGYMASDIW